MISTERRTITADAARRVIAGCEAYAAANGLNLAFWVLDAFGGPVSFQRMEGATHINTDTALKKAKTALDWGMPTDPAGFLGEVLNMPNGQVLMNQINSFPVMGGIPIVHEGAVIGAVGVGGGRSVHDAACAQAGIDALLSD